MYRISFCTVSMNRLYHIRETLPVNIEQNLGYPDIEFVLLDYNSGDGLQDWVRDNMMAHIKSGLLKYYRTEEPEYFDISHSKNMASRLSTGDILCMIDGDNYAGDCYAHWINSIFLRQGRNALVVVSKEEAMKHGDLGGKLSFHRDFFFDVRGFDESLAGYGMDDVDLADRIELAGGRKVYMEDPAFLKFIHHPEIDRVKNYRLINNLDGMYVSIDEFRPTRTAVLYVMKDDTYHQVLYEFDETIKNDRLLSMKGWYVKKGGYTEGVVERTQDGIALLGKEKVQYRRDAQRSLSCYLNGKKMTWANITADNPLYLKLIFAYNTSRNFLKYQENHANRLGVNPSGWGRGTVYCNFNYHNPIHV
ncbi:MAG: glycosyltransferase family 2 protein [Bacteroidetes bacterium]|nr:glycosyltransferase family 2 protein [Bacteroidota bacterium]